MVELNAIEARVLGSLMEKEVTTPENYPLSLNVLVNACNQKSSREPVMELREADVRTLADSRVPKFENRVRDGLNLHRDEFAVVCLLLLRGPQTIAELRARAERMYEFEDNAAVSATLERLAGRVEPLAPLTVLLQRQPGAREARWMHMLSGAVTGAAAEEYGSTSETAGRNAGRERATAAAYSDVLQRLELLEEAAFSYEERLRELEEKLLVMEGGKGG